MCRIGCNLAILQQIMVRVPSEVGVSPGGSDDGQAGYHDWNSNQICREGMVGLLHLFRQRNPEAEDE